MPDYDDIDPMDDFEPDDYDDDVDPWEAAYAWVNGMDIYVPPDFLQFRGDFANPEDIRAKPFANSTDALEYLFNTGAFPFSHIIYDPIQDLYFVAVGDSK